MNLSEKLRRENIELWNRILRHPFITEMEKASLPERKFKYYLSQDSYYLDGLLRVIAYAAAKAPSRELIRFFAEFMIATIEGEIAVQNKIRSIIEVKEERIDRVTEEYISYMLRVAKEEGFPEIMASIMPCMWTYELIGDLLKDTLAASHRVYGIWVKEYCSQPYRDLVSKLKKILDDMEDSLTQGQIDKMREHFRRCSEFELKFWDMAYNWSSTSLSK